jgi:polysaccharide export outer membrane protein
MAYSSQGSSTVDAGRRILLLAMVILCAGCASAPLPIPQEMTKPPRPLAPYSATEALKEFEGGAEPEYRLGLGDTITIQVWDHAELSGSQIVGPDGAITVPAGGTLKISGKTRDEATKAVKDELSKFYAKVAVSVRVDRYASNRVVILGQVRLPGVIQFDTMPTLMEALARAGGLTGDPTTNLTHCAIIRGRDRVAWIDIRALLQNANLALNLKLKPDDLVFIPERSDLPVYVLGQFAKPGPVRWKANLNVLDAIALAGGATRHGNSTIQIVSPSRGLQTGARGHDIILQSGDIVYLPTSGMSDVGYVLEQLDPFGWVFLGSSIRASATD